MVKLRALRSELLVNITHEAEWAPAILDVAIKRNSCLGSNPSHSSCPISKQEMGRWWEGGREGEVTSISNNWRWYISVIVTSMNYYVNK
jgi:hypothetical protein